jgi:hypothetical protein
MCWLLRVLIIMVHVGLFIVYLNFEMSCLFQLLPRDTKFRILKFSIQKVRPKNERENRQ